VRSLLESSQDIPTEDVVSLLDFFTQPHAEKKKPLAKLLEVSRLSENAQGPSGSEQQVIDIVCKQFLYDYSSTSYPPCLLLLTLFPKPQRNVMVARRENVAYLLQHMKGLPLEQVVVSALITSVCHAQPPTPLIAVHA